MPEKRKDTERMTFYLSKDTVSALNSYITLNYTMADSYGAYSQTADAAISCFCANMNNKSSCGVDPNMVDWDNFEERLKNLPTSSHFIKGDPNAPSLPVGYRNNGPMMPILTVKEEPMKETIDRVIEEHKETLDKLAEGDKKYEVS